MRATRRARPRSGTGMAVASRLILESIADARLSDDETGAHRVRFDLSPQTAHVHAQVLLHIARRIAPHCVEQLVMREGSPGMLQHCPKELPLCPGKMNRCCTAPH